MGSMLPLRWGVGLPRVGVPRVGVPRVGVPRVGEPRVGVPGVGEPRLVRIECITLLISSPSLGQPLRKAFD